MILREQWEERRRQWIGFNHWEAEHLVPERTAVEVLADLSAIWSWLPEEVRREDPDPEKLGIRKMRSALARLAPRP